MAIWNPWHGCRKFSPGCANCYVYRRDAEFGKDASIVKRTRQFDAPLKKNRLGEYKMTDDGEYVYCCMTSDFFIEEADAWRPEIWDIIRTRSDLNFSIITKRIHRFNECLPDDWGDGWDNVSIVCTCEDQTAANMRLPIFLNLPIKHKSIICEPLLGRIDIRNFLKSKAISSVICGGESGENARECDFGWVLFLMEQCVESGTAFHFKQTGANFKKGDRIYRIDRKDQMTQAAKAGVDYLP